MPASGQYPQKQDGWSLAAHIPTRRHCRSDERLHYACIDPEQFVQNKLESFDDKDFKNLKKYIANIGCTDLAAGGRVGFNTGANCYLKGVEKINSGKIAKGAEARNFVKFANQAYKLGRNVLKFGVIPEMLWIGGETLIRMGLGEGLNEKQ